MRYAQEAQEDALGHVLHPAILVAYYVPGNVQVLGDHADAQ